MREGGGYPRSMGCGRCEVMGTREGGGVSAVVTREGRGECRGYP